jgi:carbon-monoxide dehydrogenase small subunit/xanthine dehydrogenase small subunit
MRFTLNGSEVEVAPPPMKRLLDVLREELRLTGTKEGCGEGECGACTVLLDGRPVASCLVPACQAAGARITTIEGLGGDHPLQRAFAREGAAQCGICTPGMILAALALPERASPEDAKRALTGNRKNRDRQALGIAARIGLTRNEVEGLHVIGSPDQVVLRDRGDAVFQEVLIGGGSELACIIEHGLVLRRRTDLLERGNCHRGEQADDDDNDHDFDEGKSV